MAETTQGEASSTDVVLCTECRGRLTANPMEGFEYSWMHFEGRKDCKLRGKGDQYLSRIGIVAGKAVNDEG